MHIDKQDTLGVTRLHLACQDEFFELDDLSPGEREALVDGKRAVSKDNNTVSDDISTDV